VVQGYVSSNSKVVNVPLKPLADGKFEMLGEYLGVVENPCSQRGIVCFLGCSKLFSIPFSILCNDCFAGEMAHHCEQRLLGSRRGRNWSERESHVWSSVMSRFYRNKFGTAYTIQCTCSSKSTLIPVCSREAHWLRAH